MKLDEKLVYLRKEKGLTQLELAEAVNVSRQAVSKWESGGGTPSTENLRGLSELYGVPVDYLLNEGEGWKSIEDNSPNKKTEEAPDTIRGSKRKVSIKWVAIVLIILILALTIGMFIANRDKKIFRLEEMKGEEVTGVPRREFNLEW